MNDLILYTTDDGRSQVKLRAKDHTVWLTQLEMADRFSATKQNISLHLKNILGEGELVEKSVVKESLTTAVDGKNYLTTLYNLETILAAGYQVRSPRGVQFRRWASTVLKEFLPKGFVMDDERLKNPDGRPDRHTAVLRHRAEPPHFRRDPENRRRTHHRRRSAESPGSPTGPLVSSSSTQ